MQSVCLFLQFVPLEDDTLDFFRPVARAIMRELRSKACLPTRPSVDGGKMGIYNHHWAGKHNILSLCLLYQNYLSSVK